MGPLIKCAAKLGFRNGETINVTIDARKEGDNYRIIFAWGVHASIPDQGEIPWFSELYASSLFYPIDTTDQGATIGHAGVLPVPDLARDYIPNYRTMGNDT